jgi:Protein of unknown function (DUF3072)
MDNETSDPPQDPHQPVSEQEPMTAEQAQRLQALARLLADTEAFDQELSSAAAQRRITALEARLERERHSGVDRFPRT